MTLEERIKMTRKSTERRIKIMEEKGPEYSRYGSNVNGNFVHTADFLGTTAQFVCLVYFLKHVEAIIAYVLTGKQSCESIESRLDDARNYLDILESLIMEGG